MANKLQVTIDVIIHATEDISKFITSFEEFFFLEQEKFSIQNLTGHYDNPITIIRAKIDKKEAQVFLSRLIKQLTKEQIDEILEDLEKRIDNSTLHLRLNKQDFIKGKIEFREKDPLKIKISTPIYNKKDKLEIFSKIFRPSN